MKIRVGDVAMGTGEMLLLSNAPIKMAAIIHQLSLIDYPRTRNIFEVPVGMGGARDNTPNRGSDG